MTTPSNAELREAIFWQLNNLLCNTTPEMCEEAREIEAAGSIKDGGRGGVDFTLIIADRLNEILALFQAREQQLLTELLEQAEPVISDDDPDEDICFEAVPVSIIEKYREGP